MSSRARGLLFATPVIAVVGCILLLALARNDPKPGIEASPVEADASAGGVAKALVQPSKRAALPATDAPAGATPLPPPLAVAIPTDDSLAATMHALEDRSPERALELARQGQALWPSGPRAAEFAATEVKCLYRLGKPSEGRGAAEAMVNKYAGSSWALEVEKQTGAHPYVNH